MHLMNHLLSHIDGWRFWVSNNKNLCIIRVINSNSGSLSNEQFLSWNISQQNSHLSTRDNNSFVLCLLKRNNRSRAYTLWYSSAHRYKSIYIYVGNTIERDANCFRSPVHSRRTFQRDWTLGGAYKSPTEFVIEKCTGNEFIKHELCLFVVCYRGFFPILSLIVRLAMWATPDAVYIYIYTGSTFKPWHFYAKDGFSRGCELIEDFVLWIVIGVRNANCWFNWLVGYFHYWVRYNCQRNYIRYSEIIYCTL